jgi:hypothetical protein
MLMSSIRQYRFSSYKFPSGFNSLANSFHIAMCHLVWLLSRKYGTVWYHPASSKLWYLTSLSFVNFQEKLTGTSSLLFARAKPAFRLAVCLTLGVLFASTNPNGVGSLDVWVSASSLAFEPWHRKRRGENPKLPRPRPPGRLRQRRSPLRRLRCRGVWHGVKEAFPVQAGFDSRVSALRSLGVRAGRTRRVSRPAHAWPRRGLPGAVRIRGEGSKDEDEWLTDMQARSVGERKGVAGLMDG